MEGTGGRAENVSVDARQTEERQDKHHGEELQRQDEYLRGFVQVRTGERAGAEMILRHRSVSIAGFDDHHAAVQIQQADEMKELIVQSNAVGTHGAVSGAAVIK
mmetsp:Transcript_28380/g.42435  ORF Transcript_28380/g.42435 Transcript_28380/m.42435 type:complete len:104 (+) Transcript_28380:1100-1411(+)